MPRERGGGDARTECGGGKRPGASTASARRKVGGKIHTPSGFLDRAPRSRQESGPTASVKLRGRRGDDRGGGSPQSSRYLSAGKRGVIANHTRRISCPLRIPNRLIILAEFTMARERTIVIDTALYLLVPQTQRMLGTGWVVPRPMPFLAPQLFSGPCTLNCQTKKTAALPKGFRERPLSLFASHPHLEGDPREALLRA
jgi:hypothetical protein